MTGAAKEQEGYFRFASFYKEPKWILKSWLLVIRQFWQSSERKSVMRSIG